MKITSKIYPIIILCLSAISFVACEKVIELDLKNTEPKLVIEANFTDSLQIQTVNIGQTVSFKADNKMTPVSNAQVSLKSDNGLALSFVEIAPGLYATNKAVKGIAGVKYTLTVTVNNKTYTAISQMPSPVKIDSLKQTSIVIFGKTNKFIQVVYKDEPGVPNYYNNRLYVNGVKRNDSFVEFDRFNDGKRVENTLFNQEPDLKTGDKIKVEFLGIDVNVYRYLFAIAQINGAGGPPTSPADPDSNFSNGALGYFSSSAFTADSVVVK